MHGLPNETSAPQRCPRCGAEADESWLAGVCPRCMLQSGLASFDEDPLSAAAAPSLEGASAPRQFGDYALLEEIGRGGMGVVYRARQLSLNRTVAVKMILAGPFASPAFVERFRAEAEAAANLQHPNIVAIHEVGEVEGLHFFSLDVVAGRDLAEFLRHGPLTPKRAGACVKTLAEAIHYAHQHGILHRDLKPSNVLIDERDQPHITDFGLAKRLSGVTDLTLTGQVLGSPNFMPPEQALSRPQAVGPWSDVYSLGAILYQIVTGRAPFQAATVTDTLQQVLHTDPVSPRLLNSSLPRDLETICLKCLQKEPVGRYQTAQELADELGRFLAGQPIRARPIGPVGKAWRWCRRKPSLASTLLLLHFALAGGLAGILWQWRRAERNAALESAARQEAEQNLYVANIHQANEALEAHNLMGVRDYLQRVAGSPEQCTMRGWEWRYLSAGCRGDQVAILGRHASWISSVASSPDGRWLASIAEDGEVKLWDWDARAEIASWRAHPDPAQGLPINRLHPLLFTPDNTTLITAGQDKAVRFWDIQTRHELVPAITNLAKAAVRLALSNDGRLLAGASSGGQVSLWSLASDPPRLLTRWNSDIAVVAGLAFSADRRTLFVGGAQQPVRRFDTSTPESPRELPVLEGSTVPLAVSPDGQWLATAGSDRNLVRLWALPGCAPRPPMPTRGGGVRALAFSPDSQVLASGLLDGQIVLWNLSDQSESITFLGHEDMVTGLAFSRDHRILASASYDRTLRLWDPAMAGQRRPVIRHGDQVNAVAFSPDSRRLGSIATEPVGRQSQVGRADQTLRLWSVDTLVQIAVATNPPGGLTLHIAFSPDGTELGVDNWDWLRFYEVTDLRPIFEVKGRLPVYASDGARRLFYSDRSIVRQDGPASRATLLVQQTNSISALALSPDARTLASSSTSPVGPIQLWDAATGQPLATLQGHTDWVVSLAFSPDGRTLASASDDSRLGIWDLSEPNPKALLRAHSGSVRWVGFSPDGRTIASCGADETVRLWNVVRRQEIAVLHGHSAAVNCVAFSPDGRWLASAGDDGAIRLWRAPTWAELEESEP